MENNETQEKQEIQEENNVTLEEVKTQLAELTTQFKESQQENKNLKEQINKLILQGNLSGEKVEEKSYSKMIGDIV